MKTWDGNEPDGRNRISLWKLDRLMQGELPEAEAIALREAVARSPEASRYLEKYSRLYSPLSPVKAGAGTGNPGTLLPEVGRVWERFMGLLAPTGNRGIGMAVACVLVVGLGVWTWRLQNPQETAIGAEERYHSKGIGKAGIRLLIQDVPVEAGNLGQARSGDTLGVSYRSEKPIHAQIWYREDEGEIQSMSAETATLDWEAAMGWRQAPVRIVLDGEWKRQMVWVVWSPSAFTAAEARKTLQGRPVRADLHSESFRLVMPD